MDIEKTPPAMRLSRPGEVAADEGGEAALGEDDEAGAPQESDHSWGFLTSSDRTRTRTTESNLLEGKGGGSGRLCGVICQFTLNRMAWVVRWGLLAGMFF